MADTLTRLITLAAAVGTLAGCAHGARRPVGAAAEVEAQVATAGEGQVAAPAEATEPPVAAAEAPREPPPAGSPAAAVAEADLEALRAEARAAEEATARARERAGPSPRPSASGQPAPDGAAQATGGAVEGGRPHGGAGRGALKGMGYVLGGWVRVCFVHPLVALLCVVGFPSYWGAAAGAVALGGVIGAAVGAGGDPSARQPGKPTGPSAEEPAPAELAVAQAVASTAVP